MTVTTALNLTMNRYPGSLLRELDLTNEHFLALLDRAIPLKTDHRAGLREGLHPDPMRV